jgi:hypothetical protein
MKVAETLHLRQLRRGFIGPLDSVKNNFFQKYVNHNKTSIKVGTCGFTRVNEVNIVSTVTGFMLIWPMRYS